MSLSEVATRLDASRSSVPRWTQAVASSGRKGLKAKRHRGPNTRLSPSQRRELVSFIMTSVLSRGRHSHLAPYCVAEIQRRYGVVYQPGHIGWRLRSLGLSSEELLHLGFYGRKLRLGCQPSSADASGQ